MCELFLDRLLKMNLSLSAKQIVLPGPASRRNRRPPAPEQGPPLKIHQELDASFAREEEENYRVRNSFFLRMKNRRLKVVDNSVMCMVLKVSCESCFNYLLRTFC